LFWFDFLRIWYFFRNSNGLMDFSNGLVALCKIDIAY
jgi:hypothetical protein